MRHHLIVALAVIVPVSGALAAEGLQNTGRGQAVMTVSAWQATEIADLAKQVSDLGQAVQHLRLEYQQLRIASLEQELQQAVANRLRIQAEKALAEQDANELHEQLRDSLDTESYANLSATSSATNARMSTLHDAEKKAFGREAEINKALDSVRRQMQAVRQ